MRPKNSLRNNWSLRRSIQASLAVVGLGFVTPPILTQQVETFDLDLSHWLSEADNWKAMSFDQALLPSITATGCSDSWLEGALDVAIPGGTLTLEVSDSTCPVYDGTSSNAQLDARIPANRTLTLTFDPPIHAFYSYYGSLAAGRSVTVTLGFADALPPRVLSGPVSQDSVLGLGHGFVSSEPVRTLTFDSSEPGTTLLGHFVGLTFERLAWFFLRRHDSFESAGGASCGGFACDFGFSHGPHRPKIFVTPTRGTGDLGEWPESRTAEGIEAGDAICRHHAAQAGMDNAATFIALLSDSNHDLGCRIRGLTGTLANNCNVSELPSAGPWWRPDGRAFGGLDEVMRPELLRRPIMVDSLGAVVEDRYFTGSTAGLAAHFFGTCNDWTDDESNGRTGSTVSTTERWIETGNLPCTGPWRLACIEPNTSVVEIEELSGGRIAFLSEASGSGRLTSWPALDLRTGESQWFFDQPLSAADSVCRREAAAAGLEAPESFVAMLSDGSRSAFERLTHDGAWYRPDGVLIAESIEDLATFPWQTPITLFASGQEGRDARVWTGIPFSWVPLASPSPEDTCRDWSTFSATATGVRGNSADASGEAAAASRWSCSSEAHLYCFSNRPDPER